MFPLFFNKVSHILAPKLSKIFRILIRKGSFPVCWRTADVTPIPKSANESFYPKDYRPISITPPNVSLIILINSTLFLLISLVLEKDYPLVMLS